MTFKTLSLALATALSLTTPTLASGVEHVMEVEGWDIYVDHGENLGCFMHAEFDDGTSFRIGFMNGGTSAYLFALNSDWDFFEAGEDYALTAVLNDNAFEGIGTGAELDGVPGIDIAFDSEEFAAELLEGGGVLTILMDDTEMYSLDMEGSGEAFLAAAFCEAAQ